MYAIYIGIIHTYLYCIELYETIKKLQYNCKAFETLFELVEMNLSWVPTKIVNMYNQNENSVHFYYGRVCENVVILEEHKII